MFMSATPTAKRSSGLRHPLSLLAISASPQRNAAKPNALLALDAEVTNVSGHCLWVLVDDEELALPLFLNSLGSDRRRSIRFLMWFGRQVHVFTGPTLTLIFLWIQSVTPIITPLRRKSDLMF